MGWHVFETRDNGPLIGGRRAGSGPPVLLLHGGPGLGFEYLAELADELAEENDVAWYQQRGLEPSTTEGPWSVAADVDDARRVLDAVGWDKAYVVGHSWGGHLALHVAEALPERLLGVLSVDPLGSVGDGRWPEFDEEIFRRTPEELRARARELDELGMKGEASDELAFEQMSLVWPAYFADPPSAPPMPKLRMASRRSAVMGQSIMADLPALEAGLPGIRVPVGFVHGARSPMPVGASTDAADRIPGAWVDVVDGAGHFVWVEAPGAVRDSLRRLTAPSVSSPESDESRCPPRSQVVNPTNRRHQMPKVTAKLNVKAVGRVIVTISDTDRAIDFYVGTLGFEKVVDVPMGPDMRWVEVAVADSKTTIALAPPPEDQEAGGKQTGICLDTTDVDADHAALKSAGVDVDDEVTRFGGPVPPMFWLRDPDGNSLIVVEPTS